MQSFFSSIADKAQTVADKAQTAISSTPLASRIHPTTGDQSQSQSASPVPASGRGSHAMATIGHQFRTLQQQYGNASPHQKIITAAKGVSLDFDCVARDVKASSKELYTWGQTEAEDIKDVTDRLAYFNFVQGSLAATLSTKLDVARTPLKVLRDKQSALSVRLNVRHNYEREISALETSKSRGYEKKVADLEGLLKKAEIDDDPLEKEVDVLARKALRDSEQAKWDALREFGEKLVLLSQAATQVVDVLPSIPPNASRRYDGAQKTAAVRVGLQGALDNYKTGHINLPIGHGNVDLSRSDTRSFGETHAEELSYISNSSSTLPRVDSSKSVSGTDQHIAKTSASPSPVIDPQQLNQAPASIPYPSSVNPAVEPLASTPTFAETGVVKSGGTDGPRPSDRPSKGSFKGSHVESSPGGGAAVLHESAEHEKKRLEEAERERILRQGGSGSGPAPESNPFESGEEKNERLEKEREERERILTGDAEAHPPAEELPAYKEF